MARIFYSIAGEGRGHATRVKTMVERLRGEHQIELFAFGQSHDLLSEAYADTDILVHEIPGLEFQYRDGRLDYFRSIGHGLRFLGGVGRVVRRVRRIMRARRPDLAITDFEPVLPRAAKSLGIPFISLDHQHFLAAYDLSALPFELRQKARFMTPSLPLFYTGQRATVISSFYFPPLKPRYSDAIQIGVLLRQQVVEARPEIGDHLVVYLRRFASDAVLDLLDSSGLEVRIYGLGERAPSGNLRFFAVSESGFLEDLRTCRAVFSNAGNQLVGEALYLQKPFFAMPESGNFEQNINAHFLRASGGGDWCHEADLDAAALRRFLDNVEFFRANIKPERLNGNERALEVIQAHLPKPAAVRVAPVVRAVSRLAT